MIVSAFCFIFPIIFGIRTRQLNKSVDECDEEGSMHMVR